MGNKITPSSIFRQITPNEVLKIGTLVKVENKIGRVSDVEKTKDQHGMPIVVHTVLFSKKIIGRTGRDKPSYICKDYRCEGKGNYSFVQVLVTL